MATIYTEIPHNWNEIEDHVTCETEKIVPYIITAKKILFYDTCSFRYHANLNTQNTTQLITYFLQKNMIIVLTRIIIMELASYSGNLEKCYINYIRILQKSGITVVVMDEELLYDILSECFSRNEEVNSYLLWAVRSLKAPVSTITETFKKDVALRKEVLEGKNQNHSDIYRNFFQKIRNNKESGDNLGEEILAICLHILSHLPGIKDGKLCIATEDKGGAGKINTLMKSTNKKYRGAKIIIYSTPKMIQSMMYSGIPFCRNDLETFLHVGDTSNVVIIGTTEFDLEIDETISLSRQALADKLLIPGSINILF